MNTVIKLVQTVAVRGVIGLQGLVLVTVLVDTLVIHAASSVLPVVNLCPATDTLVIATRVVQMNTLEKHASCLAVLSANLVSVNSMQGNAVLVV